MDLGEVGWGDVDWIGLAQDRNRWRALVNAVMNLITFLMNIKNKNCKMGKIPHYWWCCELLYFLYSL
jgi:hypothetical protein